MADATFYSGPWLTLVIIALICIVRAFWIGREGTDASGNAAHWKQQPRVWFWALAGVGLLGYAFAQWFEHINSSPASLR